MVKINDICHMIAVIKGDIIASRKLINPEKWLMPLKELLGSWGTSPRQWELVWGDFFQLEVADPFNALERAIEIKALIKSIKPVDTSKNIGSIDVRMAIGIGEKTHSAQRISESNGPVFIFSGEKFEKLRKEKTTLALQSPWEDFNDEMNLCLRLANTFMDKWSLSSAELVKMILENPNTTQKEIGKVLGIKQSSVSGRWNRANVDEVKELNAMYCKKLKKLIL
jgi:predicted XRE-type DNA-binding protein